MSYRLTNDNDETLTLSLTGMCWYGLLDLATEYGWNPIGTMPSSWELEARRVTAELDLGEYGAVLPERHYSGLGFGYANGDERMVVLEDALNLADALERAFLEYEPRRLPSITDLALHGENGNAHRPSIGAILETAAFCRGGAFWIGRM